MKLDIKALGVTCGIAWGGAILLVGFGNLIWSGYGQAFLDLASSIYPGYKATASLGQVVIGSLYGLVDGTIGGLIVAWIYNHFARSSQAA